MKPKTLVFTIAVILQGALLTSVVYYLREASDARSDAILMEDDDEPIGMGEMIQQNSMQIPFVHFITGSGRVIPSSDYVHIGAPFSGMVDKVFVKEGMLVEEGQELFHIDESRYEDTLLEKKAEYETAVAKYKRLQEAPSESVLAIKAKELEQKQIAYNQKAKDHKIFQTLHSEEAVSTREMEEKELLLRIATIEKEIAAFEYEQIKMGPSHEEKEVGLALVHEKEVEMGSIEKKIRECHVKAPMQGRILSIKVHQGEFIDPTHKPALVMGADDPLHLEVTIEEKEAWRVSPMKGLRAIARHPNNPHMHFILGFVGVKPCMHETDKEKRKLILLFAFDKGKAPIYFEQNLDVYIEAAPVSDTAYLDYQFRQMR